MTGNRIAPDGIANSTINENAVILIESDAIALAGIRSPHEVIVGVNEEAIIVGQRDGSGWIGAQKIAQNQIAGAGDDVHPEVRISGNDIPRPRNSSTNGVI